MCLQMVSVSRPTVSTKKTSGPNPLPSVISYYSIQLPFSVLRNKYYVIFALPFCMTKISVVFHGSFGFVALVGSQTHRTGRLLYKSNFRSLPGIAGGSPIDL